VLESLAKMKKKKRMGKRQRQKQKCEKSVNNMRVKKPKQRITKRPAMMAVSHEDSKKIRRIELVFGVLMPSPGLGGRICSGFYTCFLR